VVRDIKLQRSFFTITKFQLHHYTGEPYWLCNVKLEICSCERNYIISQYHPYRDFFVKWAVLRKLLLWLIRAAAATAEVCSGETFDASCTSGTVLMIENAVYGRMRIGGKCGMTQTASCSGNVTPYVERHCAGRRRCDMPVSDGIRSWASENQGCGRDQLGYLRVTYYCLPGKRSLLLDQRFTVFFLSVWSLRLYPVIHYSSPRLFFRLPNWDFYGFPYDQGHREFPSGSSREFPGMWLS